jgi:hypothetical protein
VPRHQEHKFKERIDIIKCPWKDLEYPQQIQTLSIESKLVMAAPSRVLNAHQAVMAEAAK